MELEIFERIALSDTPFGPLVDVDERRVWVYPRTPLLGKSLKVEAGSSISELPGTISNRLEGNDVGVIDLRHCDWRRGRKSWWIGVGVGKGLTAG